MAVEFRRFAEPAARRDCVPQVDAGAATGIYGPTFGQGSASNEYAAAVGWRIGPGGLFDLPAINTAAARPARGIPRCQFVNTCHFVSMADNLLQ